MEPLVVLPELTIPSDAMSVSYTRDLDDGGPAAARSTPATVVLRCELKRVDGLSEEQRDRILAHPKIRADRRGTFNVHCTRFRSRARNLEGARQQLRALLREALDDSAPDEPEEQPPRPRRRGRGAGLIKRP